MRLKEFLDYLGPKEEVRRYFGYTELDFDLLIEDQGDNIVKIYSQNNMFVVYYSHDLSLYPLWIYKSISYHYYNIVKELNLYKSALCFFGCEIFNQYSDFEYFNYRDFDEFLTENAYNLIQIKKDFKGNFTLYPINPYTNKALKNRYSIPNTSDQAILEFLNLLIEDQEYKIKNIIFNKEGETENMADYKNNYSDYAVDADNRKKDLGLNFEFGPCTGSNIRMSLYGIAVKNNSGNYVSYDKKTGNIVDVDIINFKGNKYFWKVPVAIKDIKIGDTIIHNRVPMFVESVKNGDIKAIDIAAAEKKEIIPVTNVFGFNFVTKVVSLFDAFGGNVNASADNPFGNMLPFLMMNDNSDRNDMLPLLMMTNPNMTQNPLMLMALMGDGMSDNMFMALALSGGNNPFTAITDNPVNNS